MLGGMNAEVCEVAKLIDHAVLQPTHTEADTRRECVSARAWGVAAVCVKSCFTRAAAEELKGSGVAVCAVTGFPHGNTAARIKAAETVLAVEEGAVEIDVVVNNGLVCAGDWRGVEEELREVRLACPRPLVLKVILETDFLTDEQIVGVCRVATDAGLDFVKTSTGFGYVKRAEGGFHTIGATERAVRLMREAAGPGVRIKASGGIRTLADVERFRALGCERLGASATEAILREAAAKYGGPLPASAALKQEGY